MKKIILFLALLSLGVSKAQVVGGYLPLNSTKSATIGSIRTNSLVVTAPTISVNNKTLTAGNTGTVAVLSDALFSVNFMGGSLNPADATTYWFGNTILAPSTTSTVGRITIPYNCTLVGYNFNTFIGGTNGSTESVTVTVSGTTNYTLTSSAIFSTAVNNYSAMGLSQSFSASDSENISIICPTWATNPTVMLFGCTLWFVRRS